MRFLIASLAVAGCASVNHAPPADLGAAGDGGALDGARAGDLAAARDLSMAAGDLSVGDLAGDDLAAVDGAAPDLAAPDLAAPPDLSSKPDLAVVCAPQTQPCDLVCQNCGANLKCSLSNNAPACFNAGNVADGAQCGKNNTDDCVAGDICIGYSNVLDLCRMFCRADGDCKNGGKCAFTINGTNFKFCSDPVNGCDPVKQTGCNAGGCYVVTPDGQTGCHMVGAGGQLAACTSDFDCKAGYACFQQGCLKLCHAGVKADCANGQNCNGVQGWQNYGVCL